MATNGTVTPVCRKRGHDHQRTSVDFPVERLDSPSDFSGIVNKRSSNRIRSGNDCDDGQHDDQKLMSTHIPYLIMLEYRLVGDSI